MSRNDCSGLWTLILLWILAVPAHSWFFAGQNPSAEKSLVALDAQGQAARFELKTADDKFLAQAQTYLQLSPLDQVGEPRYGISFAMDAFP